jgi:catechol 2,3-dioxygenase-like lactoylglutathione lyase family enzyme
VFYEAALAPFGVKVMEVDDEVVFGPEGAEDLALAAAGAGPPSGPLHIAFLAADRPQVDAFHRAALGAGGRDNGAPGPRPQYHPGYYGAYVLDPDGNNVEAVFHDRS